MKQCEIFPIWGYWQCLLFKVTEFNFCIFLTLELSSFLFKSWYSVVFLVIVIEFIVFIELLGNFVIGDSVSDVNLTFLPCFLTFVLMFCSILFICCISWIGSCSFFWLMCFIFFVFYTLFQWPSLLRWFPPSGLFDSKNGFGFLIVFSCHFFYLRSGWLRHVVSLTKN